MSVVDYLVGLQASFDSQALRPPAPADNERARLRAQAQATQALAAWCLQGTMPRLRQRFLVGALRGAAGAEALALMTWADAFARQMDGGIRLDAMSTALQGLAWRLQTKLNDARAWRTRQPSDPWDAGWALSTPGTLRRLQADWIPRRATLVLADAADHEALSLALAALWQRHGRFRHPVRWLWVGGGGADLPAEPGQLVARFNLAAVAGPG
ncbi:MAG: hypothetical protein QE285_04100 [Aquabacterium sp.]|nr:hypothetical protein [Aquabacterium sp.]